MRRLFEGGAYSSNYCNWQLKSLLHLGQIVITFRTLLHLGQNVTTFRPSTGGLSYDEIIVIIVIIDIAVISPFFVYSYFKNKQTNKRERFVEFVRFQFVKSTRRFGMIRLRSSNTGNIFA